MAEQTSAPSTTETTNATNAAETSGTSTTAEQTEPQTAPAAGPNAEQFAEATQRAEQAAAERDELRAALDAVTKALNPNAAEAEQDPAKLAAAVAERDRLLDENAAALRTARVELAVARAAADAGARGDRLLNSRSFLDSVAELDPSDPKFDEQLGAAIKTAVEGDPDLYRAGPAPAPRGGAEFRGAPGGERRPATLHDAIAARLGS
ncbi:hypothetical protein GCM10010329_17300 [Streptomyces spiroverticillatus]|uniref:Scaffolding protein n=1 Tax=Streptomyces finlayi TaxID=67296 RepID=A0A919C7R9_9ACTN|nr:hypothetical protein [Streptomyces finlayi]GGZ96622.1 hypothetical protein GCM10010329_17300 [Streptomyces spiroverticillatus]GHC81946.1 hypothetical protein GCM10010334_09780 [Streptomyces finlayi]